MRLDARTALGLGLAIGLAAGVVLTVATGPSAGPSSAAPRPQNVPEEAKWADAFGQDRWVHCALVESEVRCQAYARSGDELVTAAYVPKRDTAPKPPFDDILARDVERVWINKVAMVPHGTVSFPNAGVSIEYAEGKRLSGPTKR